MNTIVTQSATTTEAGTRAVYWLSNRIWHGRTIADLQAMGIQFTGDSQGNYVEAILPSGWYVRDSAESTFQKQLVDQDGAIHARLYYQPGSAGGGMEMCIEGSAAVAA